MSSAIPKDLEHLYGGNPDGRQAVSGARKTYEPKNLWQNHHEILNLLALGHKSVDVAEMCGVTPATVSNIKNSQLGQEKLALLRSARDAGACNVQDEITSMLPSAMRVYKKILEDENSGASLSLQKQTADTLVMDLGGHAAAKKVDVTSRHIATTEITELRNRGLEYAKKMGIVVDGEVVEDEDEDAGTDPAAGDAAGDLGGVEAGQAGLLLHSGTGGSAE